MIGALLIAVVALVAGTLGWLLGRRMALADSHSDSSAVSGNRRVRRRKKRRPTTDVINKSTALADRRVRLDDALWVDVLSCLDRSALGCVERIARRFHRLVTSHLDDKCFRRLTEVKLR